MDDANPFAGFDWMAKDLVQRRNGQGGMTEVDEEHGRETSSGTGQSWARDDSQKEKPMEVDKTLPGESTSSLHSGKRSATVAPALTPVEVKVSSIAAETGFDFGVPGCHHLPVSSSTTSLDGDEDGTSGAAAASDSAIHSAGDSAAIATTSVVGSSGSSKHLPAK